MTNCVLGCVPNVIRDVSAGSEAGSLVATEMLNPVVNEPWRSTDLDVDNTRLVFAVDDANADPRAVRMVALVGVRSSIGAYWRIRGGGTIGTYEQLVPTSLEASSGMLKTYTDVDEGDTPDGNWMTWDTVTSGPYARYGFASPSANLISGRVQEVRAYLRKVGAGSALAVLRVYEGGVLRASRGQASVTSTTGAWYRWVWDADVLANIDGSGVELQIEAALGAIEIGSVVWNAQIEDAAADFDSGGLPIYDTDIRGVSHILSSDRAQDLFYVTPTPAYLLSADVDCDTVQVDLFDERWGADSADYYNSDNYLEVGYARAGPILATGVNIAPAYGHDVDQIADVEELGDGSVMVSRHATKRIYDMSWPYLDQETEAIQKMTLWLNHYTGPGPGIVVMPEPDRTGVQSLQTFLARVVPGSLRSRHGETPGKSSMVGKLREW